MMKRERETGKRKKEGRDRKKERKITRTNE